LQQQWGYSRIDLDSNKNDFEMGTDEKEGK